MPSIRLCSNCVYRHLSPKYLPCMHCIEDDSRPSWVDKLITRQALLAERARIDALLAATEYKAGDHVLVEMTVLSGPNLDGEYELEFLRDTRIFIIYLTHDQIYGKTLDYARKE